MYPEIALVNGEEYKIDTNFNTALKCFEILEDETITDEERAMAIVYLLFDFIPDKNLDLFLEKAIFFLQCGQTTEEQSSKKKDMDFIQDKKYIISSFMSDYNIDLSKENIHFWQFIDYIQGLTEASSLNRLRELRNCDTSKIEDERQKTEIEKAKKEVALKIKQPHLTKEQQESVDNFYREMGMQRK